MDPLGGIALAGNVLQFIEFSSKILTTSFQIYQSADGTSKDRHALEEMTRDFVVVATKLSQSSGFAVHRENLDNTIQRLVAHTVILGEQGLPSNDTVDSVGIAATSCIDVANQMLRRLEGLKCKGGHRSWASLKAALRELWNESEVATMSQELDRYRKRLELEILISLRESLPLMTQHHADQLEKLKISIRDTIKSIFLQNEPITTQNSIVALSPETLEGLSRQHKESREHTTQAIQAALRAKNLQPLRLDELISHGVFEDVAERCSKLLEEENRLLDSLKFPVMLDREEEISEAEQETFYWIFENPRPDDLPWKNFSEWIQSDESFYWITGKAGSGKSTIMKYLFCHPRTNQLLNEWARDTPLLVAGFFFWRAGSNLQHSQEGLLRSLIYQILSGHPELIPFLMSKIPKLSGMLKAVDDNTWTARQAEKALKVLTQQDVIALKFCFFIDGLDEYNGDHRTISGLLKSVSRIEGVKICVSSRPLTVFDQQFKTGPDLMLQHLTFRDIQTYVTKRLIKSDYVTNLSQHDPELISRLCTEIISKASGVFLWVRIVVSSLVEGIGNFDRESDLEERLRELPEDLEQLYWHMLNSVKRPSYSIQSFQLLQIVHRAAKPLTLIQLVYAEIDNALSRDKIPEFYSADKRRVECELMEGRLKARCLGLIEVATPPITGFDNTERKVQFLHQSVADFLETNEVQRKMNHSLKEKLFSPYFSLMGAGIHELKHLASKEQAKQFATLGSRNWYLVAWPIIRNFAHYAVQEEKVSIKARIERIEQMDCIANSLFKAYKDAEHRFDLSIEVHWSERLREGQQLHNLQLDGSLLSFTIERGIYYFAMSIVDDMGDSKYFKGRSKKRLSRYALLAEEAARRNGRIPPQVYQHGQELRDKLKRISESRFQKIFTPFPTRALSKTNTKEEEDLEILSNVHHLKSDGSPYRNEDYQPAGEGRLRTRI